MFTDRQIVLEILLVHPSKGTEEISYCCPQSLNSIGVHLATAIPIIIPCPFFGPMTHCAVLALDPRIASPLLGVAASLRPSIMVDMRPQGSPIGMLAHAQTTLPALPANGADHRGRSVS